MADSRGHLVFACGESLYAVPADCAQEVVSVPALTRVPGAPAHLLGVFAHRGEVIPVIDLASLTGSATPSAFRRAVLVKVGRGGLALTASRVAGVSVLQGTFDALGTTGIQAHLKGPAKAPAGDVAVIEPDGFFEFLTHGS
jgi:purine-binding chemotaxis protein CheW